MSSLYVFICTKTTAPTVVPPYSRTQDEMNRRVSMAMTANASGVLTVGDLKFRPIPNAIPNHLLCDGTAVGRTQFPELFALLGTSEGAGDGSTTFNIPNYSGQALEAASDGVQTITDRGTVEGPNPVTVPSGSGSVGGTSGGNIISGGRANRIAE